MIRPKYSYACVFKSFSERIIHILAQVHCGTQQSAFLGFEDMRMKSVVQLCFWVNFLLNMLLLG